MDLNRRLRATSPVMSSPLRVDYVSPLPPVRSGIADYSADLLPRLAPLCDLRVVRLPNQLVTAELEQRWSPVPSSVLGEEGRLPLYQMGNNEHHAEAWKLAHEIPGVLTLHDLVLHHLLIELTLGEGDSEGYAERLEADHGWLGTDVARAREWTELGQSAVFGLPAHRTLLRRQRGVLVHSRWAADTLAESDEELAVRVVPMGVPLSEPASEAEAAGWRERAGVPSGASLIGSFGFQTPIKRTDRAIEALASEALAGVHLLIGGEVSGNLDLEGVVREAGVGDRVHFLGFLDFDEFETAIAACDLCLNLRYPTAGETSASLLRMLALARPAIVSDYAQFSELPDDVAVKVPLGEGEVEALATTVGSLLADRQRLRRMSRAAHEYVARVHDPRRAAEAVVAACSELGVLEPLGDRAAVVPPPTSFLYRSLPGSLEVAGADKPWPEGERRRLGVHLRNEGIARWLSAEHEIGGVMIDVHWRKEHKGEAGEQHWLELPRDLDPGDSIDLEIAIRRPLVDANLLVIEPHLREITGFNAIDGPSWIRELE